MTEATRTIRGPVQRRSNQPRQTTLSARAVCSIVSSDNSGFFPPQPGRLLGDEQHDDLAQRHVSHQPHIAAALEVVKADLALGDAEHVFDAPAAEGHLQQLFKAGLGRGVGDEVFDLAGVHVAGDDQPVGAVGGPAAGMVGAAVTLEPDMRRPHVPDLRAEGLSLEGETPPLLTFERLAPEHRVVGTFGDERGLGRAVPGEAGPAAEVRRDFSDLKQSQRVQVVEELGLAAVVFVEADPVEADAVAQGMLDLFDADLPLGAVDDAVWAWRQRSRSLCQVFSGRYRSLSSIVWNCP
jgi:hypothetical protein